MIIRTFFVAVHNAPLIGICVFDFTQIPEAVNSVPNHTWLTGEGIPDCPSSRSELRDALRRAEAQVRSLRAKLNPED